MSKSQEAYQNENPAQLSLNGIFILRNITISS